MDLFMQAIMARRQKEEVATPTLPPALWFGAINFALCIAAPADLAYTEVLQMSIGATGMARGIGKSIDLLLGFAIGHMTDTCSMPLGRRRPFIVAGIFIGMPMVYLFNVPPQPQSMESHVVRRVSSTDESALVVPRVDCALGLLGNCSAVLHCINEQIAVSALPSPSDLAYGVAGVGSGGGEQSSYFSML